MKTKYLNEVAEIRVGNSAPQGEEPFNNGKYNFFRTFDVGQVKQGEISESRDKVNKETYSNLKTFQINTILFPKSGASTFNNNRVIIKEEGAIASHLAGIKANPENLNDYYLYYFLLTVDAKDLVQDSAYPSVNLKQISQIEIPVPSLQEQEKIVERLDKVFENIDKLIEDSVKNVENSKNLFFSFLNETFTGNGSEDLIELEKLSTYISRGLQPKYTDKSKTLVINQRCIRDNQINFEVGRYHDQNIKKVSDDKKIQIGDILINSTGVGTLGRVAQVTELPNNDVTVDTHVTIFRPNFNILNKEFTNWLFIYLENLIEKMGVGASGQTELRREDLKNMKIIIPPNEKAQQDISDKLNKLNNPYDNYLRLKEDLIIKYSMLRKSILNKEFSYE
jgi:restriction endonuclease S subunit